MVVGIVLFTIQLRQVPCHSVGSPGHPQPLWPGRSTAIRWGPQVTVYFKKHRFPIPAHQAIKGEFVLAGLVGFDIREPPSCVALQTGSIQQRIDPPRIGREVPQLTLPQRFSPPLLGLDGAMKPLIYTGETFRNYQQESWS
jgi:hypothetical protein